MRVSWGFATQVLWGSFLCWFKVLPVWFTLVYTNLHTLFCALCFLCFLFSVFCVLHSWAVWSAVDLMLIVDFWLLLTLTFGNLHNVYILRIVGRFEVLFTGYYLQNNDTKYNLWICASVHYSWAVWSAVDSLPLTIHFLRIPARSVITPLPLRAHA